jgi:PIN domain nuclease of toxin-antitoxin system
MLEPLYAVDTNALIWYLTGDRKLSKRAAQVFAFAEQGETHLYVSVITIAELYYANKKWKWFEDFAATYRDMKARPYFHFVPFLPDEVLDFDKDETVPEMHDRIITGLARRLEAPLLTSDPLIAAAKMVEIVW